MGNSVSHRFDIIDTFRTSNGKFGDSLGNVAVVDCNYISDYFAYNLLGRNGDFHEEPDFNFCKYASSVVGVIDD